VPPTPACASFIKKVAPTSGAVPCSILPCLPAYLYCPLPVRTAVWYRRHQGDWPDRGGALLHPAPGEDLRHHRRQPVGAAQHAQRGQHRSAQHGQHGMVQPAQRKGPLPLAVQHRAAASPINQSINRACQCICMGCASFRSLCPWAHLSCCPPTLPAAAAPICSGEEPFTPPSPDCTPANTLPAAATGR